MGFEIQNYTELTQIETLQDTALGIMKWGKNNSFPQTLKNLIDQSPVAKPAISRVTKFYKGGKFEGEDTVISSTGLTLKGLVSILADDYATFEAFCIHSNFNLEGIVSSMSPLRITDLRFNEFDELNTSSKLGYHPNFGLNSVVKKTIVQTVTRGKIKWINKFNPRSVLKQIENTRGGISNYNGQVLYHSEAGSSCYPIPTLQPQINYMLSDVENSILVRKETSTGFINSYVLKTMLSSEDPNLKALESAIEQAQGARGSGKIITLSGLSPDEVQNSLLEEIGSGGPGAAAIIESCTKTYELSHKVINGAYLIPPILSGAEQKIGFSSADLKEAYFVFNSVTQPGRDAIESGINRVLANGNFGVKSIKLQRLTLDEETLPTTTKLIKGSLNIKSSKKFSNSLIEKTDLERRMQSGGFIISDSTESTSDLRDRMQSGGIGIENSFPIMGGPGSGPNPGEERGSYGISEEDYKTASEVYKYTSNKFDTPEKNTINAYTTLGYEVNDSIREDNLRESDKAFIKNMEASLLKLPIEKTSTLYRGINLPPEELSKMKPGSELTFQGFTSTTKSESIAKEFENISPWGGSPAVFKILSHKDGRSVSEFSHHPSEQEVVFKTNTKWEVVSKKGNTITIKQK